MKELIQLPTRNLKNTLQIFTKNIKQRHDCEDVVSLKENLYQKASSNFLSDSMMQYYHFDKYDDLTLAIIQMIVGSDLEALSTFTRYFDFEQCAACPSINSLIRNGDITEGKSLILVGRIIDLLSKYFEVPAPKSFEEMVHEFFNCYKHWSIEHLVLFYGKCKSRTYATKYQHISTKGINPEYFFKWATEFEKQRVSANQSLLEEGRGLAIISPKFSKAMVNKLGKNGKLFTQCPVKKSRLVTLKRENEEQEAKKSLKLKWTEAYVNEKLKFDSNHFQKKEDELFEIATQELSEKYAAWAQDYRNTFSHLPVPQEDSDNSQDIYIPEKDEEGRGVKINHAPRNMRVYLDRLIKLEISKINKNNEEPVEKILSRGLRTIIERKQITTANELYQFLFDRVLSKDYDLQQLSVLIIANQTKRYNEAYFAYKNKEIDEGRFPMEQSTFLNYQARGWVCKNANK